MNRLPLVSWSSLERLWLVLVLYSCFEAAQADAAAAGSNNDADDPIVSIPLIPHRVVRERRRLERGGESAALVDDEPLWDRSHYPRRQLGEDGDEDGGADDGSPKQVAGLFQGYGTHYADLWCGTPTPQRQTVIVDTGSGVTAFPCSGCKDCGVPTYHIDELFTAEDSDSFVKLPCDSCKRGHCSSGSGECRIGMSYQEGSSWSAYEAQDSCYVGGLHQRPLLLDESHKDDLDPYVAPDFSFPLKFGCQTSLTGLFKTQLADGIMGMDNADAAFWKQMYDAGKITRQVFSMCFSRVSKVDRGGTEAGSMTLGGNDARLHNSEMVYTNIERSGGFFGIRLRYIYLRDAKGGESARSADPEAELVNLNIPEADLNRGSVIVDSGTTDTYFTRKIGGAFKSNWQSMTGKVYTHDAMELTEEEVNSFPTIVFQIKGNEDLNKAVQCEGDQACIGLAGDVDPEHPYDVLVAMPPSHYFELDDDTGKYVGRFYTDEGAGSVLGANMMMGHDVFFDMENSRIGWAESSCDYTEAISSFVKDEDKDQIIQTARDTHPKEEGEEDTETTETESQQKANTKDDDAEDDDDIDDQVEDDATGEGYGGGGEGVEEGVVPIGAGLCSSMTCQGGLLAGVVVMVILVAVRLWKRSAPSAGGGGPTYELQPAELELQNAGSSDDDDDVNGDGEFIRYRDHPSGLKQIGGGGGGSNKENTAIGTANIDEEKPVTGVLS